MTTCRPASVLLLIHAFNYVVYLKLRDYLFYVPKTMAFFTLDLITCLKFILPCHLHLIYGPIKLKGILVKYQLTPFFRLGLSLTLFHVRFIIFCVIVNVSSLAIQVQKNGVALTWIFVKCVSALNKVQRNGVWIKCAVYFYLFYPNLYQGNN